jgi:hypothetical protein
MGRIDTDPYSIHADNLNRNSSFKDKEKTPTSLILLYNIPLVAVNRK